MEDEQIHRLLRIITLQHYPYCTGPISQQCYTPATCLIHKQLDAPNCMETEQVTSSLASTFKSLEASVGNCIQAQRKLTDTPAMRHKRLKYRFKRLKYRFSLKKTAAEMPGRERTQESVQQLIEKSGEKDKKYALLINYRNRNTLRHLSIAFQRSLLQNYLARKST